MNSLTLHQCEGVTRSIARWGSVVAAMLFGLAFVTDRTLSYGLFAGHIVQILLVLVVFAGYLLAWRDRFEALGSVLVLAAVGMFYGWNRHSITGSEPTGPYFLAVAVPALFHLLAFAIAHAYASGGDKSESDKPAGPLSS